MEDVEGGGGRAFEARTRPKLQAVLPLNEKDEGLNVCSVEFVDH